MNTQDRIRKIKRAILKWPYNLIFILVLVTYLFLTIYINELYVTFATLFDYRKSFLIPFLFFHTLIALLIPLSVNLAIMKVKEVQEINSIVKGGSASFFGVLVGILGGACPGCFAGLFPLVLGLFGVSLTLSSFPLLGLEVQIASTVLLFISIFLLTNDYACAT